MRMAMIGSTGRCPPLSHPVARGLHATSDDGGAGSSAAACPVPDHPRRASRGHRR